MSKEIKAGPKYTDLKRRFLFLIGAMIVFRLGSHIPIPGIDPAQLSKLFEGQGGGLLGMLDMFSGGSLSRLSVFALGIMPYISSSIIVQLMTSVMPQLEALKKEGESGRKKISQYTRYGTVLLAVVQSFILTAGIQSEAGLVIMPGYMFVLTAVISWTTGTMFLMWLGEQITERGIGNGISLLIFAGIVVGLPNAIAGLFQLVSSGQMLPFTALLICVIVVLVTGFVVFVERGQRRILVNYAKRQVGNKLYGGQSSHVPLKLNMSGVMPAIFASSLVMFLGTILQFLGRGDTVFSDVVRDISAALSRGQPAYTLFFASMIIFFCFFYTALVFNPKDIAENLKKSGAFVPGIRPGQQTGAYLERVMMRLTLAGAIYITLICLLPDFMAVSWNVPFHFGGTSLLIIVVVTMDFMAQVQNYMMSQQYESLLKKANFKASGH